MADDDTPSLAQQLLGTVPLVMRALAAELRQSEHFMATAHFRLLWMLEHRKFSLSELAEHLHVSLPTMSNSVTILEERGWAERVRSPEDRRKVVIEITPEGRAVLAEVNSMAEARVDQIMETLSTQDRDTLQAGLLILRRAFAPAIEEFCADETGKAEPS